MKNYSAVCMNQNQINSIRKAVKLLMDPYGKEVIQENMKSSLPNFFNPRLMNNVPHPEKVSLYSNYQLNNITRKEGYQLSRNTNQPLPTRINEGKFMDALDLIRCALGNNYCLNMILVKEPKKRNWSVAWLEIIDESGVWRF